MFLKIPCRRYKDDTGWGWEEHFLFYNLSQNIDSLKDILQILWTLLGPLFKGPAPSAWYQKKGPVILYISCSTTVQKFLTVPDISVQVCLKVRTCNSLKGPHRNKMKGAYCSELYSELFLFYNALLYICRYWDIRSKIGGFGPLNP